MMLIHFLTTKQKVDTGSLFTPGTCLDVSAKMNIATL